MRFSLAAVAAALSLSACGQSAPREVLSCAAPFTKDASAASLSAYFGAANVTDEIVPGPEGTTQRATVIYGKDPKRRVEVLFADETGRRGLMRAAVSEPTTIWTGPGALRMGMGLDAVERATGGRSC